MPYLCSTRTRQASQRCSTDDKSRAELAKPAWAIMPRCSFAYPKEEKISATSPTHPLCITWLYTSYIYTDNKVKLSTKVNTSRWGTFKVHHHPQSTWLYTYIYTDNKVKLSVYPYMRMGIVTTTSHPVFSFHCIPLFLFLPSFCHPNLTFACKSKLKSLNLHFP